MKPPVFGIATAVLAMTVLLQACTPAPAVKRFDTPDDAAKAVRAAFTANDTSAMTAIFGADAEKDLTSGDPIADQHDRQVMALAMQQSSRWNPLAGDRQELVIGDEEWPFPIPLKKVGGGWYFDTDAGRDEFLSRRIGRNELQVIDLSRAYVLMQEEYASQPRDGKAAGLYAQQLRSSPGRQDGLYWQVGPEEKTSPLGDLVAQASAGGYDEGKDSSQQPFWGYRFRVLTAQGAAAKGGARSYIENGEMTGGFGLVAYPADYGQGGIMTFIVNQDGIVFQADLGEETAKVASTMDAFDPGPKWTVVKEPTS